MSTRRRTGFTVAPDGVRLFFEVTGCSQPAPTVVLCDGLSCDGYIWKYLQWALSERYRVIHFHYRGHGQSSLPLDLSRLKLSDFSRDALCVLDACETESAVFIGHSMGVQVSLEAFNQSPARVAALVLICGSFGTPLRTFRGSDRLETLLPLIRAGVSRMPSVVGSVLRAILPTEMSFLLAQQFELDGRLIRREDFFPYLEGVARMDPRMFVATLAAAGQHSAQDILRRIAVPTLIVAGRRDSFTPAHLSVTMSSQIPGSQLHVVEQGSHSAPIERPLEVAEVIGRFLARHLSPPAADGP